MRIFLIIFSFLMALPLILTAQDPELVFENEIKRISTILADQLSARKVKRAAVADFSFQNKQHTRLGVHMADEISTGMTMFGSAFNIVSREQARKELYGKQPQMDPIDLEGAGEVIGDATTEDYGETESEKQADKIRAGAKVLGELTNIFKSNKVLKGADAIVYGTIERVGDYLKVNIEVVENSKRNDNLAAARGRFVLTPVIQEMLHSTSRPTESRPQPTVVSTPGPSDPGPSGPVISTTPKGGTAITFKHDNLHFEVSGCVQTGRDVECKLNILALEKDVTLNTYINNTRIIDANGGYEFPVSEMKLADLSTTRNRVEKTLVADFPIEGIFRFRNINRKLVSIARLEISCHSNHGGYFLAKLNNIPVQ
jgi:hypothetical protein